MKPQDLIVAVTVGLVLGAGLAGTADRAFKKPEPQEPEPVFEAPEPPPPPASGKPATIPLDAPTLPQDESEAMKAWKERKAALDAYGPSFKHPNEIWSPIDDPKTALAFYKLPEKVQSNIWNLVFKRQAEAMAKFMAYMEAQNALDAEKPPQ